MKRYKRLVPYSAYDVPAIEYWLEEMAGKGFHLDVLVGQYAWFFKGEPAAVRYRLEPWGESEPRLDEEMEAMYEASGWEYVQQMMVENFHLWRSTRTDAREIHDDPIVQSYGFSWAEKRIRRIFLICAAVFLAVLVFLVGAEWYNRMRPWPYPWPRTRNSWSFWLRVFPSLLLCITTVSGLFMDWLAVRRVRKCLQEGIPMERRWGGFPYRKALFWGLLLGLAIELVFAYCVMRFMR